jgi:hypothetical protein
MRRAMRILSDDVRGAVDQQKQRPPDIPEALQANLVLAAL